MPIGDTATVGGGAWGWSYHADDETEHRWKENPGQWWQGYFDGVDRVARDNFRIGTDPRARVSDYLPPHRSNEQIVPIIAAIAGDLPRTSIVNIPNTGGLVPGIPENFAVEVPALISARGITGIPTGGLPPLPLSYLIRDRVIPVDLELEAYTSGSRRLLEELVCIDPWTRSTRQARDFVSDIFSLPFHHEMAAHYR